MNTQIWRKIHRWSGLFLVGFILFYCFTGLLLNHRRDFDYFQTRRESVSRIEVGDQHALTTFIDAYKRQINREDNPAVIRIKPDGVVEFLYGSHGRTTFVIDPKEGTMTRIDKEDQQPWYLLNRLHKAYKTTSFWLVLTDTIALLVIFLTMSGLLILRYRQQDILLLTAGIVVFLLGMALT